MKSISIILQQVSSYALNISLDALWNTDLGKNSFSNLMVFSFFF